MSWDPLWEEIFKKHEWGKYPNESFIRFMARNFYNKDRSKVKVLEIGSGTGAFIWYLAREGFDTYGIDGSETAIKRCEERLKSEKLKANLRIGDVTNLEYEDDYFDVVLDHECLSCNSFESTREILKEVKRVIKPDGLFYSNTYSDRMSIGEGYKEHGKGLVSDIKLGPLKGKGFIRISNHDLLNELYDGLFKIVSVDYIEESFESENILTSEFVILASKINEVIP